MISRGSMGKQIATAPASRMACGGQAKKMANGDPAKKMASGGVVRGDGCCTKGKTKGRNC